MSNSIHMASRLATRLSFFVAGFGVACWAPLIPLIKIRLGVDEGTLGLLILCLGIGSLCAMVSTSILSSLYGSKPVIVAGAIGLALMLPILSVIDSPLLMGLTLFVFGASIGSMDVAMNVHAVEVDQAADKPLMSGFHGLYSVGGFIGAGFITLLLSTGLNALLSTIICSSLMIAAILYAYHGFIKVKPGNEAPLFVLPKGIVLVIAILAAILFLVEGAILDWGALLVVERGLADTKNAGIGFMLFSIAMTIGRFFGDAIVHKLGDYRVMFWGGILAIIGFITVLFMPMKLIALSGFLLTGIGASNLVPILFRRVGSQKVMPVNLAVSAVGSMGYAGILLGPAAIGWIAELSSLTIAFVVLTMLMLSAPLLAARITKS